MGLGERDAIILFTQIWPAYYMLMMIAGAAISLGGLYDLWTARQAAARARAWWARSQAPARPCVLG